MRKRIFFILGIVLLEGLLLFVGLSPQFWAGLQRARAASSVHYVVANQAQCGSKMPCYTQLQTAVDAAGSGDEIRVAAGTYTGVSTRQGETQLVYVDKTLTIRGGYHPSTWGYDPALNATILDAQGQGRVMTIIGEVAPVIEGLRFTNGSAQTGGGLYVYSATATLRQNRIYSNAATYSGAGLYLLYSPSIIQNNQVYSNVTGANGHGGGLNLAGSPAQVKENTFTANQAHTGGAMKLSNAGAFVYSNTFQSNTAFDYLSGSNTFDGAGGGIEVTDSRLTETIRNNLFRQNTARRGGGINTFNTAIVIAENSFQQNNAPYHGGALYIQWGTPVIQYNKIFSNTANEFGGGMFIWAGDVNVRGNTWQGNTAGWRGGAIYGESSGLYDGNIFRGNSATEQGGGLFAYSDAGAVYANNVWLNNHAAQGGGLYLWGVSSHFINNTIAGNSSTDGRGVVIDKYPGLVAPEDPTIAWATVLFTNTIISGHNTGIFATSGNTLTVNSILWYNTPVTITAAGVTMTLLNQFTGNPNFAADGYHLQGEASAAVDRGVKAGTPRDIDGQQRPPVYDLGVDEVMPQVQVAPNTPAGFTYVNAMAGTTMTVAIPAQPFTAPFTLQHIPYPQPPAGFTQSVLADWITFGSPFRLTPFIGGVAAPALGLRSPLVMTMTWPKPPDNFEPGTLNLFAITSRLVEGTTVYSYQPASCNIIPPTLLVGGGIGGISLCGFGGTPSSIVPRANAEQFQPDRLSATDEFVYFWFMAKALEAQQPEKVYLPVIIK